MSRERISFHDGKTRVPKRRRIGASPEGSESHVSLSSSLVLFCLMLHRGKNNLHVRDAMKTIADAWYVLCLMLNCLT